jgi:flavin reductase (DIM6/NTAB) family NADH-FMN oxidoreductase RutF
MTNKMKVIDPREIKDNMFKLIADDWMLITAGDIASFNTMTASWGAFGELWHKKVCFCFVRPVRYTYEFMERAQRFTLSFYDESYRDALSFCGKVSGRDVNKVKQTGLTPVQTESGVVYFGESRLVFECKKIYTADITPERFLSSDIHECYPKKDYHRMYVGEIVNCLVTM